MFSIKNKVIVLTGGTGIIGSAFIKGITDSGGKVVILGRNKTIGQQREQEVNDAGGEALFLSADVLDEASLESACKQAIDKYGQIDALVNAAGGNIPEAVIGPDQNIFDFNFEALKQCFDLNLYGTILPTTIFGRHMTENGGTIINISSMAAQSAITRVLGYSMAKGAIDNFTRWMAVELANRFGDKIRMNAIAPGFLVTKQNKDLLINETGEYTARGKAVIDNTPYKRFGAPQELNGVLIWLLSDASKFVTGEVICVDGGFHIFSGV